jgi:polyhydroxybutyrate depolymerase
MRDAGRDVRDSIRAGDHTWPGGFQYLPRLLVGATNRDVDASELIRSFLAAPPRGRPGGAP